MNDLVSVVIPIYNSQEYLEETINSVINQTHENLEIILIDDGSTDNSAIICKKLASVDKRIVYIYKTNGGVVEARNLGIQKAKGDFILPVDSDDIIYESYVEKAVCVFKSINVDIVYCEAELFGNKEGKWDLPEYSLKNILKDNCIFVSAVFRRECWERIGGYKDYMAYSYEDYDLWLSMIENGAIVYRIPEILFKYRIRDNSRSSISQFNKKDIISKHKQLFKKNINLLERRDLKAYISVEFKTTKSIFYKLKLAIAYLLLKIHVINKLNTKFIN